MMSDQVEKYRAYKRFIQLLLTCCGLWPGSKKPGLFYRLLPILGICGGTVIVIALGNFCRTNIKNIGLVTKASGLLGSFCAVLLKALLFSLYRKDLHEVYVQLRSLFEEALEDPLLRKSLLSRLRFFHRPSHAITLSTVFVLGIHMIRPPKIIANELITGITPEVYPSTYPAVYFWSLQSSLFLYILQYILETLFAFFVLCVTAGVDSFFGFYMFQMSGLLGVLAFEFQNAKATDSQEELLRKCITVYSQLIRYGNILQEVYGPIVLLMAVTNALILCSSVFQALQPGSMSIEKAILSLFYIFLKIAQTFMYAWYGHIVSEQSEVLQREIYCSDWYENKSEAYKTGVFLLITQRPIGLTACSFFRISLEFFVRILSTTLSYFALLQTLDDSA